MKLEIVFKDGRKETFHGVGSFNVAQEQNEVAQTPTEGMLFEVNPLGIDRNIFEKCMSDQKQESTRQIILEAFSEIDKNPEKYSSAFYTMIPEKNWNGSKSVKEFETFANDLGGKMADWIEQALEWAQRLTNGESWEVICNDYDTANCYRLIYWRNGYYRLIGGSNYDCCYSSPVSGIFYHSDESNLDFQNTVPLIVFKKM